MRTVQDSLNSEITDREADQLVSENASCDQLVSTNDEDKTRAECCFNAVHGAELTQIEFLKLMLASLPPLLVNKLLSSCHGSSFGGKTREQLHSLLSQLTSIHTQQRYFSGLLLL